MYILFPIGIMYYFGTNLDNKFTVPDFWPRPEQTNKIPFEKEEIAAELERMRRQRLERRQIRLEREAQLQELESRAQNGAEGDLRAIVSQTFHQATPSKTSVWDYLKPNDAKDW